MVVWGRHSRCSFKSLDKIRFKALKEVGCSENERDLSIKDTKVDEVCVQVSVGILKTEKDSHCTQYRLHVRGTT